MALDKLNSRKYRAHKERVFNRDGRICRYCGSDEEPLHIDHIISRKRGGTHDLENLQVLCEKCNRGKRDQGKFHDFRPSEDSLIIALREILYTAKELDIAEASLISKAKRKAV